MLTEAVTIGMLQLIMNPSGVDAMNGLKELLGLLVSITIYNN